MWSKTVDGTISQRNTCYIRYFIWSLRHEHHKSTFENKYTHWRTTHAFAAIQMRRRTCEYIHYKEVFFAAVEEQSAPLECGASQRGLSCATRTQHTLTHCQKQLAIATTDVLHIARAILAVRVCTDTCRRPVLISLMFVNLFTSESDVPSGDSVQIEFII